MPEPVQQYTCTAKVVDISQQAQLYTFDNGKTVKFLPGALGEKLRRGANCELRFAYAQDLKDFLAPSPCSRILDVVGVRKLTPRQVIDLSKSTLTKIAQADEGMQQS